LFLCTSYIFYGFPRTDGLATTTDIAILLKILSGVKSSCFRLVASKRSLDPIACYSGLICAFDLVTRIDISSKIRLSIRQVESYRVA